MFFVRPVDFKIHLKVLVLLCLFMIFNSCSFISKSGHKPRHQELFKSSEERNIKVDTITGRIHLQSNEKPSKNTTVYIRLLDTTDLDAESIIITQQVLPDVVWSDIGTPGLQYELSSENIDPSRRYEVSVLVDCDGDGQLSQGDFYTMQSYPVLTQGFPHVVDIYVSQIQ